MARTLIFWSGIYFACRLYFLKIYDGDFWTRVGCEPPLRAPPGPANSSELLTAKNELGVWCQPAGKGRNCENQR